MHHGRHYKFKKVKGVESMLRIFGLCLLLMSYAVSAADKPNILVIWGDDIGF